MWHNALNLQGAPPCASCFIITYSDIEGGWPGTGNIDEDPAFVDAANGDYHLLSTSPGLDVGTAVNVPDHDFEGDPRPSFNGYDMGADEVSSILAAIPTTGGTLTAPDGTAVQLPVR